MRRYCTDPSSASSTTASQTECYVTQPEDIDPAQLIPLKTIGKGCFGKVVLARWEDELVAVKIIPKKTVAPRCMQEKVKTEMKIMRIIAASSPFLCYCRGAYQTDQVLLFAMNYASGGDLLFHLQLEGVFDEGRVRVMMMQIVLGLQHLHRQGVVHRDLKLENILVTSEGLIQISDFGLSKLLPRIAPRSKKAVSRMNSSYLDRDVMDTKRPSCFPFPSFLRSSKPVNEVVWGKAVTLCGTPAYRAPEIVEGREYGIEVDYWALGCIAYECLTGWSAFGGKTTKAVSRSILCMQPRLHDLRRTISSAAKKFILALLCKDPEQRLGQGVDGARKVRDHAFFVGSESLAYSDVTWDQVKQLDIPATVLLNQGGIVRNPEQANCFLKEFINLDIAEDVPLPKAQIHIEGFCRIPDFWIYDKFVQRPTSDSSSSNGITLPSLPVEVSAVMST